MSSSLWPLEDLELVSDMKKAYVPRREIPLSSTRARLVRSKPSIYDTEENEYENEYINNQPSRGLAANRGSYMRRPGGEPSFLENQTETLKSIRQVSGLGYSNDIIEHTLGGSNSNPKPFDMSTIKVGASSIPATSGSSPLKAKSTNRLNNDADVKFADMPLIHLKPSPTSSSCSTPTNALNDTPAQLPTPPKVLKPKLSPPNPVSSLQSAVLESSASTPALFEIIVSAKKVSRPKTMQSNGKVLHIVQPLPPAVAYRSPRVTTKYDNTMREKDKLLDINSPLQFPPLR